MRHAVKTTTSVIAPDKALCFQPRSSDIFLLSAGKRVGVTQ